MAASSPHGSGPERAATHARPMQIHDRSSVSPSRSRLAATLLLSSLLTVHAAPLAGQEPTAADRSPEAALPGGPGGVERASGGHGIQLRDGRPLGLGRGYRADFAAGRVDFVPALGAKAANELPLSFELEEIRLGDELVHAADPTVEPTLDGDFVRYARGAAIVEQYEVQEGAVHQSFLFDELPFGKGGDLVVRGRLHTDLPAPLVLEDGGLLFEEPGVGGVTVGAVTGIDANGASVQGTLRSDGEHLELVLPGDFVANAAFPLLLDPILAPLVAVNDSGWNDRNPDLCYAGSSYYVVWERVFAANSSSIMLQRVSLQGALMGAPEVVYSSQINQDPAVGFVDATNRLLIAWTYAHSVDPASTKIAMASYDVLSDDVSPADYVHFPGGPQSRVRVGGDESGTDDEAFLVWQEEGFGIRGILVNVPDGPVPAAATPVIEIDDSTGTQDALHPDISESVSFDGDFLVVWERRSTTNGIGQVWGRAYNRNGAPLWVGPTFLSSHVVFSYSAHYPSVDGNGETFLVAYERGEDIQATNFDIACRPVTIRPDGLDTPLLAEVVAGTPDDDQLRPCVTVTGTTAVVAWIDQFFWFNGVGYPAYSAFAKNVDLFSGEPWGELELMHSGDFLNDLAVAARASGDWMTSGSAMFAWGATAFGAGHSDVAALRYSAPGSVGISASGCGSSGEHFVENAVAGNDEFAIHLRGSTPDSFAVLVIAGSSEPVECGPCTLFPKLESVYYETTDANGDARVDIPIGVELAGVTFLSQWAVFAPGGACTLVDLNLSRALTTIIGTEP